MAALRSEPAETLLAGERQILEMICTGKDLPTVTRRALLLDR
jgi:hypothetical protein